MKHYIKYFLSFFFFLLVFESGFSQRFSLYYTKTLYDGIHNPHHRSLDTCKSWSTGFFFPSFGIDVSIKGEANKIFKAALASENVSNYKLKYGSKYANHISSNFNYDIFMLKVRVGRKNDAEWSLGLQTKFRSDLSISNEFFNFLFQGNTSHVGQTINNFATIEGPVTAYSEFAVGYRQRIYDKLSGGFKVGYVLGLVNAIADVEESSFYTRDPGDSISVRLKGTLKSSIDPENTNISDKDVINNRGFSFSGGLQYELTPKATLGLSVLDLGYIKWHDKSRVYKLDKTVDYIGVPVLVESSFRDSILDRIKDFVVDSSFGSYKTTLPASLELTGNYRWTKWFNNTLILSKPLYQPDLDIVLLHDFVLARAINFIFTTGYNTSDKAPSIGAQFLVRSKGFDFYFGSERALNMYQVSRQLVDHTQKPSLPLGASYNFGVAFRFGNCPKQPVSTFVAPTDADGDGILDIIDECPYKAGPSENRGCPWPDADVDSVLDKDDPCPNVFGPVANKGCPWPDTDKDSIPDKDDLCPTVAGPKATKGCPDTDGDGVLDKDDACLKVPGPVANLGCPYVDTDKDSIPDKDDKCPVEPGPVSNNGCPVPPKKVELTKEEQEVINKVFSNLTFETGKAIISASSFISLDALYDLLIKKPNFKVLIEGHTDNVGKPLSNKRLSEQRAAAVKKYLVDKGIEETRLIDKGYGSARPVASNKTPAGRAKNRRVEFTVLE